MKLFDLLKEEINREIKQIEADKAYENLSKILGDKWKWPYTKKGSAYNFKSDNTRAISLTSQIIKGDRISVLISANENKVTISAYFDDNQIFNKILKYNFSSKELNDLSLVIPSIKQHIKSAAKKVEKLYGAQINKMADYYKDKNDNRAFIRTHH